MLIYTIFVAFPWSNGFNYEIYFSPRFGLANAIKT